MFVLKQTVCCFVQNLCIVQSDMSLLVTLLLLTINNCNICWQSPKYRQTQYANWKQNFRSLMESVEDYARQWGWLMHSRNGSNPLRHRLDDILASELRQLWNHEFLSYKIEYFIAANAYSWCFPPMLFVFGLERLISPSFEGAHFCIACTFYQFCLCPLDFMIPGYQMSAFVLFWIILPMSRKVAISHLWGSMLLWVAH